MFSATLIHSRAISTKRKNFTFEQTSTCIMKKIFLSFIAFLFTICSYAQEAKTVKPEKDNSEIKQLQADRDTAKAELKRKTLENTKNINKLLRMENENKRLKEQLSAAKKAKKNDKAETIQGKITDNVQALKELNTQIKEEEKELDKLDKEVKNAEKALKNGKEKAAKEKAKSKK